MFFSQARTAGGAPPHNHQPLPRSLQRHSASRAPHLNPTSSTTANRASTARAGGSRIRSLHSAGPATRAARHPNIAGRYINPDISHWGGIRASHSTAHSAALQSSTPGQRPASFTSREENALEPQGKGLGPDSARPPKGSDPQAIPGDPEGRRLLSARPPPSTTGQKYPFRCQQSLVAAVIAGGGGGYQEPDNAAVRPLPPLQKATDASCTCHGDSARQQSLGAPRGRGVPEGAGHGAKGLRTGEGRSAAGIGAKTAGAADPSAGASLQLPPTQTHSPCRAHGAPRILPPEGDVASGAVCLPASKDGGRALGGGAERGESALPPSSDRRPSPCAPPQAPEEARPPEPKRPHMADKSLQRPQLPSPEETPPAAHQQQHPEGRPTKAVSKCHPHPARGHWGTRKGRRGPVGRARQGESRGEGRPVKEAWGPGGGIGEAIGSSSCRGRGVCCSAAGTE